MTGDKFNKKSGQALLIIVISISVAMVVILSLSFKTVTDTQLTKSQEESLSTVAAADSAVELGFTQTENTATRTFRQAGLTQFPNINLDQSTLQISSASIPDYISPPIEKDEQYTFYWASFGTRTLGASAAAQTIKVHYGSNPNADCAKMALEFTILHGDIANLDVRKNIADTGNLFNSTTSQIGSVFGETVKEIEFACFASLPIPTNTKLVIVRYLTNEVQDYETRLGFTPQAGSDLPAQGKIVRAEAISVSGVKKIVESVQTYPQIPAEFFVTTL